MRLARSGVVVGPGYEDVHVVLFSETAGRDVCRRFRNAVQADRSERGVLCDALLVIREGIHV